MILTKGEEKMFDSKAIIKSIRLTCNDEGGIAFVRSKILNIEKHLTKWTKDHPNNSTIMQPEENTIVLINDLRNKSLLK